MLALRAEVRKAEERLAQAERDARQAGEEARRSGRSTIRAGPANATVWQKKYAEVMEALDRAEAMWLEAQEKLEGAGA